MTELEFRTELEKHGIILNDDQMRQFDTYYHTLIEWNQKMNLTAITDKEDVYLKHFYDSLTIAFAFDFNDQTLVDVGAGAGFPSIPLKIVYPHLKVTIVDSLTKRITFLNTLFKELGLKDCQAISIRAEDYAMQHREQADIVMARAVARLNILDELCLPLVKVGGYFLSLKGMKAQDELTEAKKGIECLGGKIESLHELILDGNEHRGNIVIKKVKLTPQKYPRNFGRIKKQPL